MANIGDYEVSDYAVLVIDVLGQTEKLTQHKTTAEIENAGDKAFQLFQETCGCVDELRNMMANASGSMNVDRPLPVPLPEGCSLNAESLESFNRLRPRSFTAYGIADTIVVYHPLAVAESSRNISVLLGLLLQCVEVMLYFHAKGVPLRGAIECGWGTVLGDGDIYGYAATKAVDLEKRCAQYPRVVVGPHAIELLQRCEQSEGDSFSMNMARFCRKFVEKDQDGLWFVNYLGREARDAPGFDAMAKAGLQFAQDKHKKYGSLGSDEFNPKLALRYALLRQYYEAHLEAEC